MEYYDDIEVRHRKKTNSGVSKASKKSDHRHKYEDVLVHLKNDSKHYRAKRCSICGMVKHIQIFETEHKPGVAGLRLMTNSEVYKKYKDTLDVYEIDSLY